MVVTGQQSIGAAKPAATGSIWSIEPMKRINIFVFVGWHFEARGLHRLAVPFLPSVGGLFLQLDF